MVWSLNLFLCNVLKIYLVQQHHKSSNTVACRGSFLHINFYFYMYMYVHVHVGCCDFAYLAENSDDLFSHLDLNFYLHNCIIGCPWLDPRGHCTPRTPTARHCLNSPTRVRLQQVENASSVCLLKFA